MCVCVFVGEKAFDVASKHSALRYGCNPKALFKPSPASANRRLILIHTKFPECDSFQCGHMLMKNITRTTLCLLMSE